MPRFQCRHFGLEGDGDGDWKLAMVDLFGGERINQQEKCLDSNIGTLVLRATGDGNWKLAMMDLFGRERINQQVVYELQNQGEKCLDSYVGTLVLKGGDGMGTGD
ncbi:hypothetical protein JOM56_010383 [Amanita muscaria]